MAHDKRVVGIGKIDLRRTRIDALRTMMIAFQKYFISGTQGALETTDMHG